MPAKDVFHSVVKNALQKDGWTITHDPLSIRFKGIDFYMDLGADKLIAVEKNGENIAVEIKSFRGESTLYEFHTALGQFMNYRMVLDKKPLERTLYLAVPLDTYDDFFTQPFGQMAIEYHQLKLIVYDVKNEVIVQWIK
jgi:hypothetical protein